jgi:hypothetical protein
VLSYPPNLKLKLPKNNDEFETKFYDVSGTPYKGVPVEDLLAKGVQVTAIMECAGVWFAGSKFGLTWKAKQIAIHKLPERINDFAFKGLGSAPAASTEDNEDEFEDDAAFKPKPSVLAAVMPQASQASQASAQVSAQVSASQEEDAVDDEASDDVEPVPAPKKTIIKKKIVTAAPKK